MNDAVGDDCSRDWVGLFPPLAELDNLWLARLRAGAQRIRLRRGLEPFRAGSPCERYLFLLSGHVRVQILSESGRELVLYRIGPGETCILTTACLLGGNRYPASAVAETDIDVAILPEPLFAELLDRSAAFRRFVFRAYARRLVDLMSLIDDVVFRRLDVRLANFLLAASADGPRIDATHYRMAVELGSAREVISRQLKEFERRGWVTLGRGAIKITDLDALRAFVVARGQSL